MQNTFLHSFRSFLLFVKGFYTIRSLDSLEPPNVQMFSHHCFPTHQRRPHHFAFGYSLFTFSFSNLFRRRRTCKKALLTIAPSIQFFPFVLTILPYSIVRKKEKWKKKQNKESELHSFPSTPSSSSHSLSFFSSLPPIGHYYPANPIVTLFFVSTCSY